MDTWPFDLISPEDFTQLTEQEKAMLQTITAAFLAFALEQRTAENDTVDQMH